MEGVSICFAIHHTFSSESRVAFYFRLFCYCFLLTSLLPRLHYYISPLVLSSFKLQWNRWRNCFINSAARSRPAAHKSPCWVMLSVRPEADTGQTCVKCFPNCNQPLTGVEGRCPWIWSPIEEEGWNKWAVCFQPPVFMHIWNCVKIPDWRPKWCKQTTKCWHIEKDMWV